MKIVSKELIDCLQLLQDVGSQFEKKDDAIRSFEPETCQELRWCYWMWSVESTFKTAAASHGDGLHSLWMDGMDFH